MPVARDRLTFVQNLRPPRIRELNSSATAMRAFDPGRILSLRRRENEGKERPTTLWDEGLHNGLHTMDPELRNLCSTTEIYGSTSARLACLR